MGPPKKKRQTDEDCRHKVVYLLLKNRYPSTTNLREACVYAVQGHAFKLSFQFRPTQFLSPSQSEICMSSHFLCAMVHVMAICVCRFGSRRSLSQPPGSYSFPQSGLEPLVSTVYMRVRSLAACLSNSILRQQLNGTSRACRPKCDLMKT